MAGFSTAAYRTEIYSGVKERAPQRKDWGVRAGEVAILRRGCVRVCTWVCMDAWLRTGASGVEQRPKGGGSVWRRSTKAAHYVAGTPSCERKTTVKKGLAHRWFGRVCVRASGRETRSQPTRRKIVEAQQRAGGVQRWRGITRASAWMCV
jgi:hypothetical protein